VGASPDRTCYRIHDVYAYAVNCLLIVGTTPERTDHKKSFDLFRSMPHGVTVVTVDELLAKLRSSRVPEIADFDPPTAEADAEGSDIEDLEEDDFDETDDEIEDH
jgi:hypothetical protein